MRRLLYPHRGKWETVFALGGEAAIAELQAAPFDVLVTDIRMPKVDGTALLRYARDHHPSMIRIALSAFTEFEPLLLGKSFELEPLVHQFLSKPCDPAVLQETIHRVVTLQRLIQNEALRAILGRIDVLPLMPWTQSPHLAPELAVNSDESDNSDNSDNSDLSALVRIAESDPSLSAKLLKIAHSSYYGAPQKNTELKEIIAHLGLDVVRGLIMSQEIPEELRPLFVAFQNHCLQTGVLLGRIFESEEAFIAGLLHDIGILILFTHFPAEVERIQATVARCGSWYFAEREVLGATHAELGAYLLGIWGLPLPVVEAIAFHHEPWMRPHEEFDLCDALFVANNLQIEHAEKPLLLLERTQLDHPYLDFMGIGESLPQWRAMAAEEVEKIEKVEKGDRPETPHPFGR